MITQRALSKELSWRKTKSLVQDQSLNVFPDASGRKYSACAKQRFRKAYFKIEPSLRK